MSKEYTAEASSALRHLCSTPIATTTLNRADTQSLLLNSDGKAMACGHLFDIVTKNLGAGVYQISLKRSN